MADSKPNGSMITSTITDNEQVGDIQESDRCTAQPYEYGIHKKSFDSCCVRGTLTFSLRYDFIHRVLMVHVIRTNDIPAEVGFDELN
ncbi:unnamed protein product [Onchocerca flexuosa]|uniref:Uncharacterized protein n=1 Tax=Onchocerca flexuosa TaxID=387005 RepID=A0A183HMS9_9BILA|nr:unnamed protein product [Onchocerca flexuosa]